MKESVSLVLDAQEVFNRVAKHLFEQGERCSTPDGACMYRLDNTAACPKRCAIGALIPDEKYSPTMESHVISAFYQASSNDVFVEDKLILRELFENVFFGDEDKKIRFLSALQSSHDMLCSWSSTASMKKRLAGIAKSYQLDASILYGLSFTDC